VTRRVRPVCEVPKCAAKSEDVGTGLLDFGLVTSYTACGKGQEIWRVLFN